MKLEHLGRIPKIAESAYIAPNATICGDVIIGEGCCILFGAVLVAEGGPVVLGKNDVVMENAVIRGTKRHPTTLGNNIIVGPHSHLTGCTLEDNVFIATGASIFNGARIGARSEVRINGVVHVNTRLPMDARVPIGWVAVGNPAKIFPPKDHAKIWSIQRKLDFPKTVWGLERAKKKCETIMPEVTRRYSRFLSKHRYDKAISG